MNPKRFAFFWLLPFLLLSACEDPSGVGLSLVGETGGEPNAAVIPISGLPERAAEDVTGAVVVSPDRTRMFAGRVDDPIVGQIESASYIDFSTVPGITQAFRDGTVTAAELRLMRDYVYGDTTSIVGLQIHDMPEAWDPQGLTSDTVLTKGPIISNTEFLAADTSIVLQLPDEWIAANDSTLRNTSFNSAFHGFALSPTSGNAVAGFDLTRSVFRVVTATDTVDYQTNHYFTSISRTPGVGLPDRVVIQDGSGPSAAIEIDPSARDTLGDVAINHVVIRVRADTNAVNVQRPPNFVRPQLTSLQLAGYRSGVLVMAFTVQVNSEGEFVFRQPQNLPFFFDELLKLEDRELRINVPPGFQTLNPVFLVAPSAPEGGPAVVLLVTRAES